MNCQRTIARIDFGWRGSFVLRLPHIPCLLVSPASYRYVAVVLYGGGNSSCHAPGNSCRSLVLALAAQAGAETPEGKVVGVRDGDDVVLLVGKTQHRIRLAGIDAPELGQTFGRRAKQTLSDLAFGKTARAEVSGRGRYGRLIGTVHIGDQNVNQQLVAGGWAWHFKRYSDDKTLARPEAEARQAKRGLWADPDPVPPWEWRRRKRR